MDAWVAIRSQFSRYDQRCRILPDHRLAGHSVHFRVGYRGGRPVSGAAATLVSGVDFHIRWSDCTGDARLLCSPSKCGSRILARNIVTRPLGASIGDFLSQARADGGLGLGPTETSYLFRVPILALVGYLTATRKGEIRGSVQPQGVAVLVRHVATESAESDRGTDRDGTAN